MARLSREFVKLETRIINDWRFFRMSEFEQLVYIKLLAISRTTGNQIPKSGAVLKDLLRTIRGVTEVISAVKRIKANFPKFKENKYFYYFDGYELRLSNYVPNVSINSGVDEDEDIDFFVITKPNRLWISRFLLMVFKKIFLLNSKKNFCINYYITTNNLEIEDKNIFIAIELASLLPIYGSDFYDKLYSSNEWIKNYVPNYPMRETKNIKKFKPCLMQKIIEPLLDNKLGSHLDDYFMNLFYKYDKKRYFDYDEKSFNSAFKIRKNISTHHPDSFQNKVLHALEQKILHLQIEHNILLI
ncbi:MAG: hypothetical protein IIB83_01400 [Bacteroidetes bacterium]|nr:hypothetical protein [Bacteroidota bacterium]